MNQKIKFLTLILFITQVNLFVVAQESSLWLRNGKKVTISSYMLDTANYYEGKINYTTLDGKNKDKFKDDVFAVIEADGTEKILYKQNLELGEILTPEQMKEYVTGIGDARASKVSPLITVGGVISGLAGAFVPQPEVNLGGNSMGLPVGIIVPAAYVAAIGATAPGENKLTSNYPVKSKTEDYLMGYQDGIRKKRLTNSLIAAGIGFVAGFLVISAVN